MDMNYTQEEMEIKTFYKYKSLSSNCCENNYYENTLKMLKDGELYFSDPNNFNDPFDCSIDETVSSTDEEFIDYLKRNKFNDDMIKNLLLKKNSGELEFSELLYKERKDYFRIFCLSKNYDNQLMWSHYADCHKGICIGLKTTIFINSLTIRCKDNQLASGIPSYLPIFRVNYNNNKLEPYNLIKMDKKNIKPFFYRKSDCWSYEEEYRIVLGENMIKNNPIIISSNEISCVYFGLLIDKEIKNEIINVILNLSNKNIRLYNMVKVQGEYKIKAEEIKV